MTKRVLICAGLALSLLVPPAAASDADSDVTLYEISERVTFRPESLDASVIFRNATSPLLGLANLGTPLCPSELLIAVPRLRKCTVSATGTSDVSTVTGIGPVYGTFDVLINAPGNSKVHVPNLPVITGTFHGTVDLSLAVLSGVPLGSITGNFTIAETADASGTSIPVTPVILPFTGTFRLPFGVDALGIVGEIDDDEDNAFYLADDLTTLIRVRDRERSVGFPSVRLEVRFGP